MDAGAWLDLSSFLFYLVYESNSCNCTTPPEGRSLLFLKCPSLHAKRWVSYVCQSTSNCSMH